MPRPREETPAELDDERATMERALAAWKMPQTRAEKLPRHYSIDFAIFGPGRYCLGFAEVKRAKLPHDALKNVGFRVSLAKMIRGRELSRWTGKPLFLIVHFDDGDFYWRDRAERPLRAVWHGRSDRNDPEDWETCAEIPLAEFRALEDFRAHEEIGVDEMTSYITRIVANDEKCTP